VWQIDFSFFCNKFQDSAVSGLVCLTVDELEQHGVGDVQSCKLLQRRRWHDDLSAVVEIFSLWAWQHDCWVAAVVLIEAFGRPTASSQHVLVHRHRIVFLVVAVVRLDMSMLDF